MLIAFIYKKKYFCPRVLFCYVTLNALLCGADCRPIQGHQALWATLMQLKNCHLEGKNVHLAVN